MIAIQFATRAARIGARLSVVMSLALAVGASEVKAQVIVDSQGFETPLFTTTFSGTGQLEGQTPATFNGTWLRTKGAGMSTAVVQSAVKASGNQAVKVDRVADSEDRWGVPVSGYPAGDFICISWDMRVEQTTGAANTFGPFFGMEAYDDDAASIGLLGSLGVDATTGDVLYQAAGTGFLTETGTTVSFGTWHNYMVDLDYITKTYTFAVDGVVLGTQGFVDEINVVGGLNEFTDANISALAAAGDPASQALLGTAYFDNFKVVEGQCIPEPTTCLLGMLGVASVASLRRTRRS